MRINLPNLTTLFCHVLKHILQQISGEASKTQLLILKLKMRIKLNALGYTKQGS